MRVQPDALSAALDGRRMPHYLLHRDGGVGTGQGIALSDDGCRLAASPNLNRAVDDQAVALQAAKDHVAAPEGCDAGRPHLKDVAIPDERLHTYAAGAKTQAAPPAQDFDSQGRKVGLAQF
jgi:hypothetical protein